MISADCFEGVIRKTSKAFVEDVSGHREIGVRVEKINEALYPVPMPHAVDLQHPDVDATFPSPGQETVQLCDSLLFRLAVVRPGRRSEHPGVRTNKALRVRRNRAFDAGERVQQNRVEVLLGTYPFKYGAFEGKLRSRRRCDCRCADKRGKSEPQETTP